MLTLLASILVVLITFLGGVYVCYALIRRVFNDALTQGERLFLSLGLGPSVITTLSYYALLISPFNSGWAYIVLIGAPVLAGAWVLWKRFRFGMGSDLKTVFSIERTADFDFVLHIPVLKHLRVYWKARELDLLKILCGAGFVFVVVEWIGFVISRPLVGHDILEYALLAETFLQNLHIEYMAHIVNEQSGFYFLGLHGYGFPLLGFWEKLIHTLFGVRSDYLFRSATGYYGFLVIALMYSFLKRYGIRLALMSVVMLFSAYAFYLLLREYHIDAMRMFGLVASWLLLYYTFKNQDKQGAYWLLGFALGMSSFIHSINFMISCFAFAVLAFFMTGDLKERISKLIVVSVPFLMFGGLHYLLDLLVGSGWILKDLLGR